MSWDVDMDCLVLVPMVLVELVVVGNFKGTVHQKCVIMFSFLCLFKLISDCFFNVNVFEE